MMPNRQTNDPQRGLGPILGMALLPILCCGLPLLIGALGFTAVETFLVASRYWIAGIAVMFVGIVMFFSSRKRRKAQSGGAQCAVLPRADATPMHRNRRE